MPEPWPCFALCSLSGGVSVPKPQPGRIRGKKSACPNAVTHSTGCLFSGSVQRILLLRGWLQLIAKCVSGNTGPSRAVHVQEDSHVQSLLTGKLSVTSSKRAEYNMPV